MTWGLATCSKLSRESRYVRPDATYHGDDFVLEGLIQGDKTKVETEIKLEGLFVSVAFLVLRLGIRPRTDLLTYRGHEEKDGDGLLGARHGGGAKRV